MVIAEDTSVKKVWQLLENISDPEIPVLSIIDLGIVKDVHLIKLPSMEEGVEVTITPTYSGCPAMDVISITIKMALLQNGFKNVKIIQQLSPAWTTDWMTEKGKEKLIAYGIAAPVGKSFDKKYLEEEIKYNAHSACQRIQSCLVNLVLLHVRPYINVTIVKSLLIILNAIE